MNDLEKFKTNVNSLEREMTDLSKIAEVYKEVASAGNSFKTSIGKMDSAVSSLSTATENLKKDVGIMDSIKSNLDSINQNCKELKTLMIIAIAVGMVAVVLGIFILAR